MLWSELPLYCLFRSPNCTVLDSYAVRTYKQTARAVRGLPPVAMAKAKAPKPASAPKPAAKAAAKASTSGTASSNRRARSVVWETTVVHADVSTVDTTKKLKFDVVDDRVDAGPDEDDGIDHSAESFVERGGKTRGPDDDVEKQAAADGTLQDILSMSDAVQTAIRDAACEVVEQLVETEGNARREAAARQTLAAARAAAASGGGEGVSGGSGGEADGVEQELDEAILEEIAVEELLRSPSKAARGKGVAESLLLEDDDRCEAAAAVVRNSAATEHVLKKLDVFPTFKVADAQVRAAGAQTSRWKRAEGGRATCRVYLCGHRTKSLFVGCRKRKRVEEEGDDEEDAEGGKQQRGGQREGGRIERMLAGDAEGRCGGFIQLQQVRAGTLLTGKWRRCALPLEPWETLYARATARQ